MHNNWYEILIENINKAIIQREDNRNRIKNNRDKSNYMIRCTNGRHLETTPFQKYHHGISVFRRYMKTK